MSPIRQGTYWIVYPKSTSRHIQSYRDMDLPLCGLGTRPNARQVFEGAEPKIEKMPLCPHCRREAARIAKAAAEEAT